MNRRRFIQSLAAVFSLPANATLTLQPAAAAIPAAVAVPAKARFWAIYITGLHGECTPQTLQKMLHIPAADAKSYISQLVADGVLKPHPLLQQTASQVLKSRDDGLVNKVKERLEMKTQTQSSETEILEKADLAEETHNHFELQESVPEADVEAIEEDELPESEDQTPTEADAESEASKTDLPQ